MLNVLVLSVALLTLTNLTSTGIKDPDNSRIKTIDRQVLLSPQLLLLDHGFAAVEVEIPSRQEPRPGQLVRAPVVPLKGYDQRGFLAVVGLDSDHKVLVRRLVDVSEFLRAAGVGAGVNTGVGYVDEV